MNTSRRSRRVRFRSLAFWALAVPGVAHAQEGMTSRVMADPRFIQPTNAAEIVAGQRSATKPLDDKVLVRYSGTSDLYEMLLNEYHHRLDGVRCIVVDERQIPRSRGWAGYLRTLRPEEVERIDLLFSGDMLRIYTIDFINRTPPGLVRLRTPSFMDRQHIEPLCT